MRHTIFFLCSLITIFFVGCNRETPPPTPEDIPVTPSVSLTGEYILHTGAALKTLTLIGQATANDQEVEGSLTWKTPEKTYDKPGEYDAQWLFTPKELKKYNSVEGKQKITVKENWIAVEQVTLNHSALNLEIGKTNTLIATITPDNASSKEISWTSDNEQIAKVDQVGVVTALAPGEAIITATAFGNQTATCTITVPNPPKKVYVIGNRDAGPSSNKALFWIDNVLQTLERSDNAVVTSLFVSGSDSYITGIVWDDLNPNPISVYWKNGKIVLLTDQGNNPFPTSIFVSGTDVYVAGYDDFAGAKTAGFWTNGKFKVFQGQLNTEPRSICVFDGDVYMAGRSRQNNVSTAIMWKNGVQSPIPDMQDAVSISVSGSDVYVAGYNSNAALYTKGTTKSLFKSATYATSMFVSGSDVYICGEETINMSRRSWYWYNGATTNLTDGTKSVGVSSICVADQKIYVAGYSFLGDLSTSTAKIWINGVVQSLPSGDVAGTSLVGVVVE